mgnify:CR=1 FL=1
MSHFVNPTREAFKAIFGLALDRPVHMLNLLQFRATAQYAPEDPEAGQPPVSGAEAYKRYSVEAGPIFSAVGGKQVWIGAPEHLFIGPQDSENWDLAFIAHYPTAQAFVDMLRNPEYHKATRHRTAATLDSRLLRCAPLPVGDTFTPGR